MCIYSKAAALQLFPLSCSRAPQKLPNKEFELFERSEFSNSRQVRGAQGTPLKAGQMTGALSFGSFSLGMQRK
jgi:hypothetical protein